jgi:hypothetical protein
MEITDFSQNVRTRVQSFILCTKSIKRFKM